MSERFARLVFRVNVGVIAVAFVGELFHHRIIQISRAETQNRQKDIALTFVFNHFDKLVIARQTDIKIAVGCQNHAVVAV